MKMFSKLFATAIALVCCVSFSSAQFEGKITMKVEAVELPAEYQSMKSMFESTMTTWVKGKKSRTEATTSMTGTTITLNDVDKGESITCVDMMGQKMATKVTYDDSKKNEAESTVKFEKQDGTKTIAGFNCKKGLYVTEANGMKQEMEVWYTEEITNSKADMREIPGMVMEINMSMQGIKMRYYVTDATKEKVANKMFEMPEGYRMVSQEELAKKLMGQ